MAKVLIVDDAAFMRQMLRNILTELGHEVIGEASNGIEAIEQYNQNPADFVTMDITMPELDGIGAVKGIKEIDPQARIIMCSAMGQQQMVVEAIQAGATDFIVKPFNKERVQKAVQKIVN